MRNWNVTGGEVQQSGAAWRGGRASPCRVGWELLVQVSGLLVMMLFGGQRLAMAQSKEVFGWVERVQIREADMPMLAKLDTGADTSSLHARHVREFDKDGVPWVQFEIRNFQGKNSEIKAPVMRVTKIKRHSGVAQRRIVIKLGLCLGEMFQEEWVSLVDRSNFDYQFLLGRSFLAGNAIIDPSAMYTSSPNCSALTRSIAPKVSDAAVSTPEVVVPGGKNTAGSGAKKQREG